MVRIHIATYALFMNGFIDNKDDAVLLHRFSCIVNGLDNDNDAIVLFNMLCKEVACYLASMFGGFSWVDGLFYLSAL